MVGLALKNVREDSVLIFLSITNLLSRSRIQEASTSPNVDDPSVRRPMPGIQHRYEVGGYRPRVVVFGVVVRLRHLSHCHIFL